MIFIIANWRARAGKGAELQKQLSKMVKVVHKNEPHCLQYDLHQGFKDKNHFFFYEKYTDNKAIELHKTTPHFKELMANTKGLIAEPVQVELLKLLD